MIDRFIITTLLGHNRRHEQTYRCKFKPLLGIDKYHRQQAELMKLYWAKRKDEEKLKPIEPIFPSQSIEQKPSKGQSYDVL